MDIYQWVVYNSSLVKGLFSISDSRTLYKVEVANIIQLGL